MSNIFDSVSLGDSDCTDALIAVLLTQAEKAVALAFSEGINVLPDDMVYAQHRIALVAAAQVRATQAATLATLRMEQTLASCLCRWETVADDADYVSVQHPSERTPPEKTASGE